MGSGTWSTPVYAAATSLRASTGTKAFAYSSNTTTSVPRTEWKAHNTLEPLDSGIRESRDSTEHPTSLAITVLFDVTGSMHTVPQRLQEKLPTLLELLLRKGYVEHPQIQFGAIGDATCDQVPLQISQWEADNRMDEHLRNILLEAGGGGTMEESYELALYYMARHTEMDCLTQRGQKGYLFIIGDEAPYGQVDHRQVRKFIGDDLQADIPLGEIISEVQEKFNFFLIRPEGSSYRPDTPAGEKIIKAWQKYLGQNLIDLADLDAVSETVALTVGMHEGTVDLDAGLKDLEEFDASTAVVKSVSSALATSGSGSGTGGSPSGTVRI